MGLAGLQNISQYTKVSVFLYSSNKHSKSKLKKRIIFLNYNYNIQLMVLLLNQLIKIDLVGGIKMETEKAPECPSSHRCTHGASPLKEMQKVAV